jgi:DNA-binding transcriptional ArsR family regulator
VKASASTTLAALADPTRETIVRLLLEGDKAVGEIAERLPISRPAVSKHLRVLERAEIVDCRSEGTRNVYGIRPDALAELRDELDRMWEIALARYTLVARNRGRKDGSPKSSSRQRSTRRKK